MMNGNWNTRDDEGRFWVVDGGWCRRCPCRNQSRVFYYQEILGGRLVSIKNHVSHQSKYYQISEMVMLTSIP